MKTQMRFQKILMIVTLIVAALTLVYAFSYCSSGIAFACKARTGQLNDPYKSGDPINASADALHAAVQSVNMTLVILGIIFIVLVAFLFITSCNTRRNYYITNYIAIGAVVLYALVFTIMLYVNVVPCHALFNAIDFAQLKQMVEGSYLSGYDDSPVMFILGYVLGVVVLLNAAVLVLNTVWKVALMKGEKELLNGNQNVPAEPVSEEVA